MGKWDLGNHLTLDGLAKGDGTLHGLLGGILLKDGRAGEAEELGLGQELFDGLVVLAELGAVALVEDEGDAFVLQGDVPGVVKSSEQMAARDWFQGLVV